MPISFLHDRPTIMLLLLDQTHMTFAMGTLKGEEVTDKLRDCYSVKGIILWTS